jgi:hypothetical protein
MQARCEYSVLTVPIDGSYMAVAVAYVGEVSKKLGFEEDQLTHHGFRCYSLGRKPGKNLGNCPVSPC